MKLCAVCNTNFEDDLTFCPRDGEVLQESPETIVGRVIDGKYEVEGFIAQGGMGAVYLARHILLGDRVVLKTLRSEMRTNAEWVRRFQREGKAARSFRHPNSVTVYDLAAGSDGLVYMVMEYVEGDTLESELKRRGRLSPAEAVEVLTPVADVLDAAHVRGVVHRDLKPENIMLGRDEHGGRLVKVLDLGIAKLIGEDAYAANVTALTTAGQLLGTPYYMSPEQWGELPRDGRAALDGRADIYSLGVIVFELIAGRRPLTGQTLAELRHKHVVEPPPALAEVVPGVSHEFSRAVARATAKDRADRPPTAGEFIDELRAALGLPLRSRPRAPEPATGPGGDSRPTQPGGEAATANLPPDALGRSRDKTPHTSEHERLSTRGVGAAEPPRPATQRGGVRETVVAAGASATVGDAPGPRAVVPETVAAAPAKVVAAPRRRSLVVPLVAGGMLLAICIAAVAGWLAWRWVRGDGAEPVRPTPGAGANVSAPPANVNVPTAPERQAEALGYWLEVFERPEDEAGRRVAEPAATLATGQRFRFHFYTPRRGYLYIVGPGTEANALMMILTAQGAGKWSKSNLAVGQADFAFPPGDGKLYLAGNAGTEDYTVIFSPTPLVEPAFLTSDFMHELTPAEVKQFEEFRARHGADAVSLAVSTEVGEPHVAVSAPERATREGAPVIFDIRISHR